jgi:hypothetical protein
MNQELTELYSDYLLSSPDQVRGRLFGAATATGLSDMLEGEVSHDRITRFLSGEVYDSRTLRQQVKPMVRKIEQPDGALIFDDTIEEKPHTDQNEIVSWRFDHSENRTVKGINILNCVYRAQGMTLPAAYEIIRKPMVFKDENTGRLKRRGEVSKNELMRRMLKVCQQNRLEYRYIPADSWFSSKENLSFIHNGLGKEFITALKSNRTAALSYEAKLQGGFHRIDTLDLPEGQPVRGWLRGPDFPVLLLRQVFKNRDGSAGTLYLAGSGLDGEGETIKAIYRKRWKVETYHKTLKGNAALAKPPGKTVRTQSNHCFMAICSACRLEWTSVTHQMNHFALRTRIYLKAIRHAFDELQLLKAA